MAKTIFDTSERIQIMKTAPVMCLLIILYSSVNKQTYANDVNFNFKKFVKVSQAVQAFSSEL